MSNKSGTSAQVISLPTGGGAVRGIGESFTPDLFTGTGNLTVPLALPPGRNGFAPELQLAYSTGRGNGPFGLGWDLTVPHVTRKTSRGVPRYTDDHDTFVLSGADDLVPVGPGSGPGATRFRPRVEKGFARIERTAGSAGDPGGTWTVASRDGLVSHFGGPGAVVADPAAPGKVFSWRLTATTDPFGNRIAYEHEADGAQLHLHEVAYVDHVVDGTERFLVTVTLVYEDRPDPFTQRRAGFALRTGRRCRRLEVRTHADGDRLARTYELVYLDDLVRAGERPATDLPANGVSLLSRLRVVGHDGAASEELPPLELAYTRFAPERRRFRMVEGPVPPVSLAADDLDTVDLFGNGLPDLVELDGGGGRFWRNRGAGRFDAPVAMAEVPAGVALRDPGVQFADMDGDGKADLLVLDQQGYYPLGFDGRWSPRGFVRYRRAPNVDFGDAELRLVDLDGDGVTDALRTGTRFELFFNDPRQGWERVETRERGPLDRFPDVRFSDPRVKLADLDGDGLQDIVLVDRGRIDHWPYLGHGRWGARATMARSPRFPTPFDPRRVLLGDVDGDGLDDVAYVEANRVTFWINRGGESWGDPVTVEGTPAFTDLDGVRLTDLLGTGTAGVLWTGDRVPGAGPHYRFLDLTGGTKPYLLEQVDNHRGAVTRITYGASVDAYLADDARPATRWRTPLPFPVPVVARVDVVDQVSGSSLTTSYRYRHGYWDGVEREFRGFGLVEQSDDEVLTRTWFHQGQVGDELDDLREPDRAGELWPGDPPALGHRAGMDAVLATLPDRRARREALRSLAGSVLRTEEYTLDGSEREDRPHSVRDLAYRVRAEGPGVFFPHGVADRVTQWERGDDPATTLTFTDDHDAYGQPRRTTNLAVPRGRDFRVPAPAGEADPVEPYLGTTTVVRRATRDDAARFLVDRVASTTTYELVDDGRRSATDLHAAVLAGAVELAVVGQTLTHYDGPAFVGLPLGRLGEFGAPVRAETLVLTPDLVGRAYGSPPPYLGPEGPDGPPAWTADHPAELRRLLAPRAGYTFSPGDADHERGWYAAESRVRYDVHDDPAGGRGLVLRSRDPSGAETRVRYDAFGLLPTLVTDPVGLAQAATYDHRVLQPLLATDANGNRTRFAYTPLGMLAGTAVMGRSGETVGDTLAVPGTRYHYDLRPGGPLSIRTVRRAHHVTDRSVPLPERDRTIESIEYADGFGRVVQTRLQGEDVTFGDPLLGAGVVPADPTDPATGADVQGRRADPADPADPAEPNVVVSGWQVYDGKGRVVEKYEPFFATGWAFAPTTDAQHGQRLVMSYDGRGRLVRTVRPDGAERRIVPGVPTEFRDPGSFTPTPWEAYSYDANDNAGRTHPESAQSYAAHWDTPEREVVDALGRRVEAVQRPGPGGDGEVRIRSRYDVRGNLVAVEDALGRPAFAYVHDLAGRVLRTESLDGGVQHTVFDAAGRPVEQGDGKGALTLRVHDRRGRPSRTWARDRTGAPVTLRERVDYGDGGDPAQPPAERAAARARNQLGVPRRHLDEAGALDVGGYDHKGNVVERTRRVLADDVALVGPVDWEPPPGTPLDRHVDTLVEAAGHTTTLTHDALNRVVVQLCPQGTEGVRQEVRLAYNRAGALEQVTLDGEVVVEHVAYDARGQRTLVALGNGVMTRHAYDPSTGRLLRLRSEGCTKPAADGLTYRPTGAPLQDLTHRYDLVGNLVAIVDRTPGSGVRANPEAALEDDPQLRALVTAGDALVRRFSYDPRYQLVEASGRACRTGGPGPGGRNDPWADAGRCGYGSGRHGPPNQDNAPDLTDVYHQTFAYDAAGNVERLGHTAGGSSRVRTFELVAGTNRLDRIVDGSVALPVVHDGRGNVVREAGTRHLTWDHRDRLVGFAVRTTPEAAASIEARYLHDAAGQRVRKLVRNQGGAVEATTYVDGTFEHHRWEGGANTVVQVSDGGRRVASVRQGPPHPDDRGPVVQYTLADHLGSAAVVVDPTGAYVNREEYTPYGESSFGSFARKRYRFCGHERDDESGLQRHGARHYAPWAARWTSPDPAGQAGGTHLYRYAGNRPTSLVDPSGRDPEDPPPDLQVGNVAPMKKQPKAVRDEAGRRLTENEHVMCHAQLGRMTCNPRTGESDYTKQHYQNDSTLRLERETSLAKTHGNRSGPNADNPRTQALKEQVEAGGGLNYRDDIFDPARLHTEQVCKATRSAATVEQINQAILEQDGNLFALQRLEDSNRIVRELTTPEPAAAASAAKAPATRLAARGAGLLSRTLQIARGVVLGEVTGRIALAVSGIEGARRDEAAVLLSVEPPGVDILIAADARFLAEVYKPFLYFAHPVFSTEELESAAEYGGLAQLREDEEEWARFNAGDW